MSKKLEELIEKCDRISLENNEIYFIIQNNNVMYSDGTDDDFVIVDHTIFETHPSIFVVYDSEFKELNNFTKFEKAYDILNRLGFNASGDYNCRIEQNFNMSVYDEDKRANMIVRVTLSPNMTIKFIKSIESPHYLLSQTVKVYFRESWILSQIYKIKNKNLKQHIRGLKIKQIIK
jgi:hypothetical protein